MRKLAHSTEFACFVRNYTGSALRLQIPFGALEPRMSPEQHAQLIARNHQRYATLKKESGQGLSPMVRSCAFIIQTYRGNWTKKVIRRSRDKRTLITSQATRRGNGRHRSSRVRVKNGQHSAPAGCAAWSWHRAAIHVRRHQAVAQHSRMRRAAFLSGTPRRLRPPARMWLSRGPSVSLERAVQESHASRALPTGAMCPIERHQPTTDSSTDARDPMTSPGGPKLSIAEPAQVALATRWRSAGPLASAGEARWPHSCRKKPLKLQRLKYLVTWQPSVKSCVASMRATMKGGEL
jgi:hypothetical protein